MKTQKEWHKLATKVGEKLFAKQEKLFKGMSDVLFYCQETSRFDTFVKLGVSVHFHSYKEEAVKLESEIGHFSSDIYLDEYKEDNELEEFLTSTMEDLEDYCTKLKDYMRKN